MIRRISQRFSNERLAGVEVIMLSDQQTIVNGVQLHLRGGKLVSNHNFTGISSMNELSTCLPLDIPINLVVSGRGTLVKKLDGSEIDAGKALQKILPNAKENDFYIQSVSTSDTTVISVVRRDTIESVVTAISGLGYRVVNVTMAPAAIQSVLPVVEQSDSLKLPHHHLDIIDRQLTDYFFSEPGGEEIMTIKLGSEDTDTRMLPAYGAVFQMLAKRHNGTAGLPVEVVRGQMEELKQKRHFVASAYAALGFFLTLLLGNALMYVHYADRYEILLAQNAGRVERLSEADTLRKRIAAHEAFLSQTGWFRFNDASFYVDRLAATVPGSVRLEKLVLHPLNDKQSRLEKKSVFEPGKGLIIGHCDNPTDLNPWVRQLRTLEWIRQVEIHQYAFDEKTDSGYFMIILEIV